MKKLLRDQLDLKCNFDLLKAIGLDLPNERRPTTIDSVTKALCRRNNISCCNSHDLMKLNPFF